MRVDEYALGAGKYNDSPQGSQSHLRLSVKGFRARIGVSSGERELRRVSASEVQQLAGIAPVTVRSGRSWAVHWRWSVPTFVRQTFHEFALQSIRFSPWARAYFAQQRARGKSKHAAARALAFKWIRIISRRWTDHTLYDEARYTRALHLRGAPLATQLPLAA